MDRDAPLDDLIAVAKSASRAETRANNLAAQRNDLIIEVWQLGYSQATVAKLANMTRQSVNQIIAKYKKEHGIQ